MPLGAGATAWLLQQAMQSEVKTHTESHKRLLWKLQVLLVKTGFLTPNLFVTNSCMLSCRQWLLAKRSGGDSPLSSYCEHEAYGCRPHTLESRTAHKFEDDTR